MNGYHSEMRKVEVYDWISKHLTDDEVLRLQGWIDDTLQSEEVGQ
jgi:hypothetical protein